MPCYDRYIEIDRSSLSRSGLYAADLPGVEISMLEGFTKEEQEDYLELHDMILSRAWTNLVSDVSIALQNKFLVDTKLLSRETSTFKDSLNSGASLAGIKFKFTLPRYARLHILSVEVFSAEAYESPEADIYFYDEDENGELLHTANGPVSEGRSTIYVDHDFEVDEIFIAYDPSLLSFRQTENRFYRTYYESFDKVECIFPCSGMDGFTGTVLQVNGGGLNVKFSVVCSIEKFVCDNLNLFKTAFWYRYGVELMDEALLGNRLNRFTTMTEERKTDRSGYFSAKYTANIGEAIKSHNIHEDPICFRCKSLAMSKTIIP